MSYQPSPVLFHGPTSHTAAARAATAWGRLCGSYGDPISGFTAATIREVASVMRSVPIHEGRNSVVLGPVDVVTQDGIMDSVLKVLEEAHPRSPRAYLWAWDLGAVRDTVASRCLQEWCGGTRVLRQEATAAARSLVDGYEVCSSLGILEALYSVRKSWPQVSGDFLHALAEEVRRRNALELWAKIRPVLCSSSPGVDDLVVAVLR